MTLFSRIDDVDLVVGELADLARARARAYEFASTSRDPDACLASEIEAAHGFPPIDCARFSAAALINYLVAKRHQDGGGT